MAKFICNIFLPQTYMYFPLLNIHFNNYFSKLHQKNMLSLYSKIWP